MSSTTPSATRKSASLARLHRENASPCPAGLDLATFLVSRRWASVNTGGCPPAERGYSDPNPSAVKLCSTSRTRSSLVKASPAICATLIPWADHSTICARRQVTTDPGPAAHDPLQAIALVIADLTYSHPASHTRQRDPVNQRREPRDARPGPPETGQT
jgi:hypothetical protein